MSTQLLNPYCTLKAAQIEAGNSDGEAAPDFLVEINKASRWLDEHCQRDFLFHDHTTTSLVVQEAWCAGNVIFLPWPVITLTEIKVAGAVLDPGSYRHSRRPQSATEKILRSGNWLDSTEPGASSALPPLIELKGTFGFAPAATNPTSTPSPDIPASISQACAAIAAIRSGNVRREITGPGGTREAITVRNVPQSILDSLKPYRICVV